MKPVVVSHGRLVVRAAGLVMAAVVVLVGVVSVDRAAAQKANTSSSPRSFHVILKSAEADPVGIMLELIVSPRQRSFTGIFEMTKPTLIRSHVSGSFQQVSSASPIKGKLTGFPQWISPCLGHGPAVTENAQIAVEIDTGWRRGVADVVYRDQEAKPQKPWTSVSHISLTGSPPVYWRNVTDILWIGGDPRAETENMCSTSDQPENRRLRRLGSDASFRQLTLDHRSEGGLTSWSLRNSSARHILARVFCESKAPGRRYIDRATSLIHPLEDQGVFAFPDRQPHECKIEQSHYD